MSAETMQWLNQNTLIGHTDKRGNAWHHRESEQGAEPNHYPGPIPIEDVRRRLFHWEPVSAPLRVTALTDSGVLDITDTSRKVIVRPDTQSVLGVFKNSYQPHGYNEWLVQNVETLLDADLSIGSAGLLKGGAVAWVQVELADTMTAAEGVEFRPFLTAATSLDGSLATTYQVGAQVVVCDNTLSLALRHNDASVKIRHSVNSLRKLNDVRDALGIVHTVADDFSAQVAALLDEKVTEDRWRQFTTAYTAPKVSTPRADKAADKVAADLAQLWRTDQRVAPWSGTAYGVLAAANTYEHHYRSTKGRGKAERNAEHMVTGEWSKVDQHALQVLATV